MPISRISFLVRGYAGGSDGSYKAPPSLIDFGNYEIIIFWIYQTYHLLYFETHFVRNYLSNRKHNVKE